MVVRFWFYNNRKCYVICATLNMSTKAESLIDALFLSFELMIHILQKEADALCACQTCRNIPVFFYPVRSSNVPHAGTRHNGENKAPTFAFMQNGFQ